MLSSTLALQDGLLADIRSRRPHDEHLHTIAFAHLSLYAAWLIEGSPHHKKYARQALIKHIAHGRRIALRCAQIPQHQKRGRP